ncbi:putative RNA 2'-phosphotransferase [Variovorax sp. OK212]|nr:putative RNA 2'-phosphotransferase [Variovorax sp. OK202]SFE42672.1 putative RNA 2'-phosphotransferase [Variovorax sp. OK212]
MIARVLRHRPEVWGVRLDGEGWCQVSDLLAGAGGHGHDLNVDELLEIVETNDKKRFTISTDGLRIRSAQGHSVPVDLELRTMVPPPVLYHGTVRQHIASIRREGLRPMTRHAVHLSATKEAAVAVGGRRGAAVVLIVDSYALHADGVLFQLSTNGVWLVEAVPPRYIAFLRSHGSKSALSVTRNR